MNTIGHKYIFFLALSGIALLASLASVAAWGLRPGIDFTGGSLMEVEFVSGDLPSADAVRSAVEKTGIGAALVQPLGERSMAIRMPYLEEEKHQEVLLALKNFVGEAGGGVEERVIEQRFDTIGPFLGKELRRRASAALVLAALGIVLYIAWAFRNVSQPVSSWKYGVAAVGALFHDIMIPTGVFSILGRFRGLEVDALFITALLTIMGFSVHDTIVVFDRIRENLRRPGKEPFPELIRRSIRETYRRSLATSVALVAVLAAVALVGGETTRIFAATLIIGIVVGTYSSLFVASPLVVLWNREARKR